MTTDRTRFEDALNKGHSYSWDQRWEEAIASFEIAVQENPKEPAPYAGLGMAYQESDKFAEALDNYKLAARYSRGNIIYLRKVAAMQEQLDRKEEAGKTYMAIGEMELGRRNLKEAMTNWQHAVKLDPDLLRAHQRLATIYQRQKDLHPAIKEYLEIARILQAQGENDKALKACKLAQQLAPRDRRILTAIEKIRQGTPLRGSGPLLNLEQASQKKSTGMLTRMIGGDEKEEETAVPVQDARRLAMSELAGDLFSDDETAETDMDQLQRDNFISKALDYQQRGMVNDAIANYEPAMEIGADSPAIHFNIGILYQDKLRFEEAITHLERSAKSHDYRLASCFALGESYRARGRSDKAVENFIEVLKIVDLGTVQHGQADRLIELYENLADSLVTGGKREQASSFANALVDFLSKRGWEDKALQARDRLDTISDAGIMILGDVLTSGSEHVLEALYLSQEYTRRGMFNTAVEETYHAIQMSPNYLPAHIQLGEILGRQGRSEIAAKKFTAVAETFIVREDINGAIIAYERVLDMMPLDVPTRLRLIELLKGRGQIDRSLEHYMSIGESYYQLARTGKSRETYKKALKLVPRATDEQAWRIRFLQAIADIDMEQFDWKRALVGYKELRQLNPDDEWIAITLVSLYYRTGQKISAVRELDIYMKQLVRAGRSNKVLGILEDMIQRQPADSNLAERLYKLYLQQNRKEDALKVLDGLGEAQLEEGDSDGARVTIQKILGLDPPNAESYEKLLASLG